MPLIPKPTDHGLSIRRGGTGATSAAGARRALDLPSLSDNNSWSGLNEFVGGFSVTLPDSLLDITNSAGHIVEFSFTGITADRTLTLPDASGTVALTSDIPRAFPVGSVFIGVVSTNPATLLGYGTWAAFGAGRVMVGLDSGDTDFDVAEEAGGAKTVAGAGTVAATATGAVPVVSAGAVDVAAQAHTHAFTGSPTSVVQPYIVCYFWKRTA